ncbi:MAG: hypothetical protein ACYCT1_08615 [Steroidobacteraceae bacterium]
MTSIREMLRLQAVERAVEQLPALKQQVEDLQARVGALEVHHSQASTVQTATRGLPDPLRQLNASRQGRCNRLREEIRSMLARRPNPHALTGKDVSRALERAGFEPMPSDRTVRLRLAEVRAEMATHGNTGNCQKTV